MANAALQNYSVLSDSLEQQLVRTAAVAEHGRRVVEFGFGAVRLAGRLVSTVYDYTVEVSAALNEARARDARFSKAHW